MYVSAQLSRVVLKADGGFLALAGGAAMIVETIGHFWGIGPFAQTQGSPHTIGGFEAHGLALIFAFLLLRAASRDDRREWHAVGLATHCLLGGANLLFWPSFVTLDVVPMGVITTVLHGVFVCVHAFCLKQ